MEPNITPEVIFRLKAGNLTAFDEMYIATIKSVWDRLYPYA
jgi:hypothetical protein